MYEFHAGGGLFSGENRFFLHVSLHNGSEEVTSVSGQRVEGLKGRKVGYYDLFGRFYSDSGGLIAGEYVEVLEVGGQLQYNRVFIDGH